MTKFDLAQDDRKLLGIIFRYAGESSHPLSCLGEATSDVRYRAMRSFSEALSIERLPKDLDQLLPLALWSLQMGLLVLFLYDSTKEQQRTRRLASGALGLTEKLLMLAYSRYLSQFASVFSRRLTKPTFYRNSTKCLRSSRQERIVQCRSRRVYLPERNDKLRNVLIVAGAVYR